MASSFVHPGYNFMDLLEIAVHQTAHDFDGGLDRLAKLMGKNSQTLRNKVNPNVESHVLGLFDAMAMMIHSQDFRILEVMAAQCGRSVKPLCAEPAPSLSVALLHVVAEQGDVSRAMEDMLASGRVTVRDRAEVREHVSEARAALDVLEAML